MGDSPQQIPVEDFEAALLYWDPVNNIVQIVTGRHDQDTASLEYPEGASDSEVQGAHVRQSMINQTINTAREHLTEILNSGIDPDFFRADGNFDDTELYDLLGLEEETEVNSEEIDESEVEDESELEDGEIVEEGGQGYSPTSHPSSDGSETEAGSELDEDEIVEAEGLEYSPPSPPFSEDGEGLLYSPTSPPLSEDQDGDGPGDRNDSCDEDMGDASVKMRTGRLNTYVSEVGTYGPHDKSSVQVILQFQAPTARATLAFNVDRYDCDSLNFDVYRYDDTVESFAEPVGSVSKTVDIDIADLGNVDDIQRVGIYLTKEDDVAGLIMSYTFDDNDEQARGKPPEARQVCGSPGLHPNSYLPLSSLC